MIHSFSFNFYPIVPGKLSNGVPEKYLFIVSGRKIWSFRFCHCILFLKFSFDFRAL
ncbi:hypothetical protein LEP1GSC186_1243 [Leptospira noguchii serovar Autumnalis str. ZUN142]|uniref:Uncharacterized protein n=1 Tax=Leptospira noguchii serovar Autumnalis str. ZUN142 TaxID=1085540 RepID=M6UE17_9LEPT|nr:hypothetical protein LEP1GSC186_1243 [Leptospira noguchii serovar Autumnalis str. ZUN142]